MQYLKATPTVVPVKSYEIGAALSEGDNVVTVGTGVVVRERGVPYPNGDYHQINTMSNPTKHRPDKFLAMYRNGSREMSAVFGQRDAGSAYITPLGLGYAQVRNSEYEPSSVYHTTYTKMDRGAPIPSITFGYVDTLGAVTARTAQETADLAARVSVLECTKAEDGGDPVQWITPTLLNGWGHDIPVSYRKDSDGMVHFVGNAVSGASSTVGFVLPKGYRPTRGVQVGTVGHNGTAWVPACVTVQDDGNVFFDHDGAKGKITLSAVSFLAEQ